MARKGGIIGGIITLVIGGTLFSVSQADIAKNLSKDTGMSEEQAQQYVEQIDEDDLVAWDELGSDFVSDGQDILTIASEIDCINYNYEWETSSLSCQKGKTQLEKYGNSEIALGKAYIELASDSADEEDMSLVITLIDDINTNLSLEIVTQMLDYATRNELRNTNAYNKALLQSVLDSN